VIDGKLALLNERIASTRILNPQDQPADEVRFGATVKFRFLTGTQKNSEQKFTIVGVDEADIKQQKIAFLAPLAKALTGKKVGEKAEVMMAGKVQKLEILSINYF
jgi:transcription elongation factor GreB